MNRRGAIDLERRSRNQITNRGVPRVLVSIRYMKSQTPTLHTHGAPTSFLNKFGQGITAILSGFDRLRFRATLRLLFVERGMEAYLNSCNVLIKDFKNLAQAKTAQIKAAAYAAARAAGRPDIFLSSSQISKEEKAREIARQDQIKEGLIVLFSAKEPCLSYSVRGDAKTKLLRLVLEPRQCTHLYHYFQHPDFGQLSVRVQTWFPFSVDVCLNGREWLARQMDRAGLTYEKRDNCFVRVSDPQRAQSLLAEQQRTDWVKVLQPLLEQAHPLHAELGRPLKQQYYWTASETEYATDVLFEDAARLAALYPQFIHHGIKTFGSRDVLRFLGHGVPSRFCGKATTNLKHRTEGICLRHWVNGNSIKIYDKQGSILRVETTILHPEQFKVFRPVVPNLKTQLKRAGFTVLGSKLVRLPKPQPSVAAQPQPSVPVQPQPDPVGQPSTPMPEEPKLAWQRLRRSVADLWRRAEVSRAANVRYLEALASVTDRTPLKQAATTLCGPVTRKGQRYRGLNPWNPQDAALLESISLGEYAINGFRNRDLRGLLYPKGRSPEQARRDAGAVSRRLRLLRAHGLIRKVSGTHRWLLTHQGRKIITALLAARQANVDELTKLAA
jgi:hypothetical protein